MTASLHDRYISHAMACPGCHAPTARYCDQGKALWVEYLVDYIMSQPDRGTRRALMVTEKRQNPHLFPLLNEKVRAQLGE